MNLEHRKYYVREDGTSPLVYLPTVDDDGNVHHLPAPSDMFQVPAPDDITNLNIKWDFVGKKWVSNSSSEELSNLMASLMPREFRNALIDNDIMPDEVTAALNLIEDMKEKAKAINAWEYSAQFNRNDPLVKRIASTFGFPDGKMDEIWLQAIAT